MKLENPVFLLRDFDLALGCQEAYIQPDFSKVKDESAILIKCELKNASFLKIKERIAESAQKLLLFDKDLAGILEELGNILYGNMSVTLRLYTGRVEFSSCEAYNRDIRLNASGTVTEEGDLDIKAKVFFSPELTGKLPEELSSVLTEESRGWRSYSLHLEKGEEKPFLKLESDRIRFDFKKIEVR